MNNKWCVIVNPQAGNGAAKKHWPMLERLLQSHLGNIEVRFTKTPQHGIKLTEEAIRDGYLQLLAVGGDGTNHEAINGILRQQTCSSEKILYGLIPIGTGNDWRRTYRIPKNIEDWVSQIARKHSVLQDAGKISYQSEGRSQSRYFTNVAGLAYDAFIVQYLSQNPTAVTNKFVYLYSIFKCLFKYKLQKARISLNDQSIEKYCYTINAGICPYSGGGMRVVPHAKPNDGLLAVTIAGALSKLGVLLNTPRFYNGRLDRHPKVNIFQTKQMSIKSLDKKPIPVEADGEFLGYTPVQIDIIPQALRIIVPENYLK